MDRYVDTDAGRFQYLQWGDEDAPPLLLLHGFNQTAHSWVELGEHLADRYRVIALTQRGHGDSLRAQDYSRATMVQDAVEVADAFGMQRFGLVGMSMGAVHAITLSTAHPERVKALVVVDYAPQVKREGVTKISSLVAVRFPSFEVAVQQTRAFNPRRSEDNIRQRLSHTMAQGPDGSWGFKVDLHMGKDGRFQEPPEVMWEQVRGVRCPTLVIRGAQSDLLEQDSAERMRDELDDGELAVVERAGHSVAGDNPEGFRDAAAPFLDRHALARD